MDDCPALGHRIRRRSIARTVMLVAAAGALIVGWGAAVRADTPTPGKCVTVDQVRAKGGWTIVTQVPNFEPYWFADDNGHFEGMDYDLVVAINKILKIPATHYTTVPWAGVLPALQVGKSDFTPEAIAVTAVRRQTFAFSYPEGDNSIEIMTRPDTGIRSAADLVGKRIGVETGSAGEATALQLRAKFKSEGKDFSSLKSYQQNLDEMLDLGDRRIDAILLNTAPITAFMKKHPGKFFNAGRVGVPLYAAWVFRKEDMGPPGCIGTEVNAALKTLREKGVIRALQQKWFGHEMTLPDYNTWKSVE
jgi:polar amino acid transport system substrate-binding protein